MLCTLQEPTGGRAAIKGLELGKENEEIKRHIGVVYQNNCLDSLLTVKENLLIRGTLYEKDYTKVRKSLAHATELLGLGDVLGRPFGKLSGGQKRRCEIARALMHTPDILFLDEPTTGLDPATRKNVWETVHKLQQELGMTVFLTTHYMEEAAKADHIGIMDRGHFVEYGTPFSLKEKYAKDKLFLIPKKGRQKKILESLAARSLNYSIREDRVLVRMDHTLSAIPLVEELKQGIEGFEVIQGTMDDVFLNVTKSME